MNRVQQLQEDLRQTQSEILGMERGEYPPDHLLLPPVDVITAGLTGVTPAAALRGARDRYRETMMAQRGRLLREIYAEENK